MNSSADPPPNGGDADDPSASPRSRAVKLLAERVRVGYEQRDGEDGDADDSLELEEPACVGATSLAIAALAVHVSRSASQGPIYWVDERGQSLLSALVQDAAERLDPQAAREDWERASVAAAQQGAGIDPGVLHDLALVPPGDDGFAWATLASAAAAGQWEPRRIPDAPWESCLAGPPWNGFFSQPPASVAPALAVAIGLLRHALGGSGWPQSWIRAAFVGSAAPTLARWQAADGSFGLSVPLTAAVALCLSASGQPDAAVVRRAVEFLLATVRDDLAWPETPRAEIRDRCRAVALVADALDSPHARAHLDWLHRVATPLPGGGRAWSWTVGGPPTRTDTQLAIKSLERLTERLPAATGVAARETVHAAREWLSISGSHPSATERYWLLRFSKGEAADHTNEDLEQLSNRALAARIESPRPA